MPKQAEAKRDGVINPQNYNFHKFYHEKIWCSKNATNQPKSTVELGYMCPRTYSWPLFFFLKMFAYYHTSLQMETRNRNVSNRVYWFETRVMIRIKWWKLYSVYMYSVFTFNISIISLLLRRDFVKLSIPENTVIIIIAQIFSIKNQYFMPLV